MNRQKLACLGFVLSIFALPVWAQRGASPSVIVTRAGETIAVPADETPLLEAAPQTMPQTMQALQQQNQWRSLAQFDEADVRALYVDGTRVFAGLSNRGVFVSTDNGKTWSEANNGIGLRTIWYFVRFDAVLYAGGVGGVFRSTDNGQIWTSAGLTTTVFDFVVAGGRLYAAGAGGIQRYESGVTWTALNNGIAGRTANVIEVSGTTLIAGLTLPTPAAPCLYRSTDGGQSWTASAAGLPNSGNITVLTATVSADKIFVGVSLVNTTTPVVYASSDGGQSWTAYGGVLSTPVGDGVTSFSGAFYLLNEGTDLYAATGSTGIARNSGTSWADVGGAGLTNSGTVYCLARAGNQLLAGTSFGLFALTQSTASWQPSQSGLKVATANVLLDGDTLVVYTPSSAIHFSTDNGQTWQTAKPFSINNVGRMRTINAFNVFSGAWYVTGRSGGVYRSADRGQTWTQETAPAFRFEPSGLFVINDKLHALSRVDLYVREASGMWTKVTATALSANFEAISGTRMAANSSAFFISTVNRLYRSTDQGANFPAVSLGTPEPTVRSVAIVGNNVLVSTLNGVFVSTDNGQTFAAPKTSFSAGDIVQVGTTLFSGGASGLYFSTNNGANWAAINAGLPTIRSATSLVVKGDQLVTGLTGFGVYAATNPDKQLAALANVSAASYASNATVAPESIVAAFGTNLASEINAASAIPLPITLSGSSIIVRDSAGFERRAPLFFVSPAQVNYQIPAGTAAGRATVFITAADGQIAAGEITIANLAPGLFAANANGQGIAAGVVLRIKSDGSQIYESIAQFDNATNRFVALPIDLGPASDQLFLVLFGTGFRAAESLAPMVATLGGVTAETLFAGASPGLIGVDQLNLRLPRALAGRGEVEINFTINGQAANRLTVTVQ